MHIGLIYKRYTVTASPIAWLTAFLQISILILIFLPLYNASASTGQVGDRDFLLDCTFNKYNNNTNYSAKFAKGWIPPEQKHRIVGDHIFFDSYYDKLKGKITKRNDERIEWTYLERPKDNRGKHYDAKRIYSYFFTTNKIATRLDFGTAYISIEYVWGTCDQQGKDRNISSEKKLSATKKKTTKSFVPNIYKEWTYLRGNGDISIYHDNRARDFLITSTNPWFDKLYNQLVKQPRTLVGVAMHWKDDGISIGNNNYVYQYPDSFGTTMFGGDKAIVLRGKFIKKMMTEKKPILEFSIRDMDSKISFAEHTTTEYRQ